MSKGRKVLNSILLGIGMVLIPFAMSRFTGVSFEDSVKSSFKLAFILSGLLAVLDVFGDIRLANKGEEEREKVMAKVKVYGWVIFLTVVVLFVLKEMMVAMVKFVLTV